ncbi:hypothetical protein ACFQX6_08110 [Streptosporangium lutulentum]
MTRGSARVSFGFPGRPIAVSSARCSRASLSIVVRSNSREGKFQEKRSSPPDSQPSRLSRVAAEAVPAAA